MSRKRKKLNPVDYMRDRIKHGHSKDMAIAYVAVVCRVSQKKAKSIYEQVKEQ
jgi:hypothetical protein